MVFAAASDDLGGSGGSGDGGDFVNETARAGTTTGKLSAAMRRVALAERRAESFEKLGSQLPPARAAPSLVAGGSAGSGACAAELWQLCAERGERGGGRVAAGS